MSKKNSNKKIIIVVIAVVIVGFIAFDWISGFSDGALDDISTNEYIERGASFELFALADICKINPSYILCHLADTETTSTPDEDEDEAEVTQFNCKSNVVMYYKDEQRNSWRQYGSTWSDIGTFDLSSSIGGGKIKAIKGDVYIKCDWNGNGEIQLKSGTTKTSFLDGFLFGTGTGAGQGTGAPVGIPAKIDNLNKNVDLKKRVKTLVGTIAELDQNDIDKIEQKLNPIVNGKYVGITFGVNLYPTFVLNGYKTSSPTVDQHMSSMKFSKILEAPTIPTVSNSRNEATQIVSITHVSTELKNNANSLDTSLDPQCNYIDCNTKHQIRIQTLMSKYLPDEGSPLITITDPTFGSTPLKITSVLGKTVGDTQYFNTFYSLPSNSKEGTWKVEMTNPNRSNVAKATFYVQNIDRNPIQCVEGANYQPRDECYSGPITNSDDDELKILEDLRVGVLWEVRDSLGRTLQCTGCQGNSFVDGGSVIPQLEELELISQVVDDRTGDTIKFYQIQIQPILKFDSTESFTPFTNWDFAQSYDSKKIPITLSIVGETATKTKYIQQSYQGSSTYKLLGTGFMSQDDSDILAETANYDVGDRFTVEANIGGEFVLRNTITNNEYDFKFDGVKISQEFQYGVKGDSNPNNPENNDEWNECLQTLDNSSRYKVPNYDGWNDGFQCQTVDEYEKQQCESNGNIWSTEGIIDYGGFCKAPIDISNNPEDDELQKAIDECNELENPIWDQAQLMCLIKTEPPNQQPRNGEKVDVDVDTKNGKIISINGENLGLDLGTNIVEGIDNIYLIAVVVGFVAVIVALRARRQSSYGLMNR